MVLYHAPSRVLTGPTPEHVREFLPRFAVYTYTRLYCGDSALPWFATHEIGLEENGAERQFARAHVHRLQSCYFQVSKFLPQLLQIECVRPVGGGMADDDWPFQVVLRQKLRLQWKRNAPGLKPLDTFGSTHTLDVI